MQRFNLGFAEPMAEFRIWRGDEDFVLIPGDLGSDPLSALGTPWVNCGPTLPLLLWAKYGRWEGWMYPLGVREEKRGRYLPANSINKTWSPCTAWSHQTLWAEPVTWSFVNLHSGLSVLGEPSCLWSVAAKKGQLDAQCLTMLLGTGPGSALGGFQIRLSGGNPPHFLGICIIFSCNSPTFLLFRKTKCVEEEKKAHNAF